MLPEENEAVEAQLPVMWAGATYQVTIQLFEDQEENEPVNLTGITVELEIGEHILTTGNGLEVEPRSGSIEVEVQADEVEPLLSSRQFTLWLSEPHPPHDPIRVPVIYGVFQAGSK